MNNDEFYEYEDRAYINPTLSSGEQEKFITNLRDLQGQNNAQIAQQTYNLGTAVPSNLGGLGGGEAYFTSRYQVPQVNEMVDTLKAAAQAQALNDIMSNYQSQLKNKYSQAQRSYNKRQRAAAAAAAAAAGNNGTNPDGTVKPKTTDIAIDPKKTYGSAWSDPSFAYSMTQYPYVLKGSMNGEVITEYYNPSTGKTYKFAGDKLVKNGKASSIMGKVYYDILEKTGKFPTDY